MKGAMRKFFLEVLCLLRRSNIYHLVLASPSAADVRKELSPSGILKEGNPLNEATLPRIKPGDAWVDSKQPMADQDDELTKRFIKRCPPVENWREGWIFKVIAGADRGRQYLAATATLKIGRHCDNHIYLKDPNISRHHALVIFSGERVMIKDLQSTNGTWVNDQPVVGEMELLPGAQIKIGETILKLEKASSKPLPAGNQLA